MRVQVHLRTDHEGPEVEQRYSSTLSLTSALYGVGGQRQAPAALPPGKRRGTYCIGGWMGPTTSLDGCGNSRPPPGFDPGHFEPRTMFNMSLQMPPVCLLLTLSRFFI